LQLLAHDVEGAGQLIQLLASVDNVDRLIQLHGTDRLGPLDKLCDRDSDKPPGEEVYEDADQDDLDAGDEVDAELEVGDLAVYAIQVQRQVEHAEHPHVRRMGMAGSLAAGGFIVDGRDHCQVAAPVFRSRDAHAGGAVDLETRLQSGVA